MAVSDVIIWHNPRCSKSRATLAILEKAGLDPVIVPYKETPPSAAEIRRALELLHLSPQELVRKSEPEYRTLNLAGADAEALIAAMAAHPALIERPVVFANGKAALGRPPEAVLTIL